MNYRTVAAIALLVLAACSRPPAPDPAEPLPSDVAATLTATAQALEPTTQPPASTAVPTTAPAPTSPSAAPTEAPATAEPAEPVDPVDIQPSPTALAFERALQVQSPAIEGDDVFAAQGRLLALGYTAVGEVDGVFGEQTAEAVRAFQTRAGLEVDGILGPATWERLFDPAAPPAPGSGSLVPIVDGRTGWLLGATRDGRWVDQFNAGWLIAGTAYSFYMPDGSITSGQGGGPRSLGVPCVETWAIDIEPPVDGGTGIAAGINGRPRQVRSGNPADAALREGVASLLRAGGIGEPDLQIESVLIADLDGDGSEESVVGATRLTGMGDGAPQPDAVAGDYSLVAIFGTGDAPTLVVGRSFPEAQEFSAPEHFALRDLLDLNGDGRLEIIVASDYYEGAAVVVYEYRDGVASEVLFNGCGV